MAFGLEKMPALVSGYHAAFLVGGIFALGGSLLAATLLREKKMSDSIAVMSH